MTSPRRAMNPAQKQDRMGVRRVRKAPKARVVVKRPVVKNYGAKATYGKTKYERDRDAKRNASS